MIGKNMHIWGYIFFSSLITLSVLSSYLYDVHNIKEGILLIYLLIALIPLVYVRKNNFNRIFGVLAVSLSLVYSTGFGVSWDYLWGYDINGEYYYANKVLSEGYWDSSITHPYNSVVSVTILAPILSLVCEVDVIYLFKIWYYFLLAFIPIVLLKAYERLLENKIYAELSTFFFIFLFTYFTEMLALARQIIAEFFLALLIYIITIKKLNPLVLTLLLIGLSLSHYSTSYLIIPVLAFLMMSRYIFPNINVKISGLHVVIFCITTVVWYSTVTGGVSFNNLVYVSHRILVMINEIFNPQYSQGLAVIVGSTTLMREIAKWINLISQGLISIGLARIIYMLLRKKFLQVKTYGEFYVASLVFYGYNIGGIVIPLFANQLNVTRLYHLSLFFLAPFFTLGGIILGEELHLLVKKISKKQKSKESVIIGLAIFLSIYLLFNSGFMLEVTRDPAPAQWLDKFHAPTWSTQERVAAYWLVLHEDSGLRIYMGDYKFPLFLGLGRGEAVIRFTEKLPAHYWEHNHVLIYLGRETVLRGEIQFGAPTVGGIPKFVQLRDTEFEKFLNNCDNIYANGHVLIYIYVPQKLHI